MSGILVLCLGISLTSGIFVLCLGYLSYVWDISFMLFAFEPLWGVHVSDNSFMYGILVHGWDISLMFRILVLSGMLVLCLGYLSYVWNISLMSGIFVLCLGYLSYVWDISLMAGTLVSQITLATPNVNHTGQPV